MFVILRGCGRVSFIIHTFRYSHDVVESHLLYVLFAIQWMWSSLIYYTLATGYATVKSRNLFARGILPLPTILHVLAELK